MFVLCVVSTDRRQNARKNKDTSTDEVKERVKNPDGGEIFHTRPDTPWGTRIFL
jgi:hypothetical protein